MTDIELFHAVEDLAEDPAIDRIIDGYPGITSFEVDTLTGEGFEGLEILGLSLSLDQMERIVDRIEGVAQKYGLELVPHRTSIFAGEAYPNFKPAQEVKEGRTTYQLTPSGQPSPYNVPAKRVQQLMDAEFGNDPDFAYVDVGPAAGMGGRSDGIFQVEAVYEDYPVPYEDIEDDLDLFIDILSGNGHVHEIRGANVFKQGDGFEVVIMLHAGVNERRGRSRRSRRSRISERSPRRF